MSKNPSSGAAAPSARTTRGASARNGNVFFSLRISDSNAEASLSAAEAGESPPSPSRVHMRASSTFENDMRACTPSFPSYLRLYSSTTSRTTPAFVASNSSSEVRSKNATVFLQCFAQRGFFCI